MDRQLLSRWWCTRFWRTVAVIFSNSLVYTLNRLCYDARINKEAIMSVLMKLLIAGGIMGVLDALWLGYVAKKLYYGEMGAVLLDKPNVIPAALFYVIYIIGVVVFVINPALEKDSVSYALGYGALFGLVAYATYDLTSLAVVKGFSTKIVVIDLIWGALLTVVVAAGTVLVVQKWLS